MNLMKLKAGDPCPTCRDTLMGTLLPHCNPNRGVSNPKDVLDDALNMGRPRGCPWLRCSECSHYGVPGHRWVRDPPAEEKIA